MARQSFQALGGIQFFPHSQCPQKSTQVPSSSPLNWVTTNSFLTFLSTSRITFECLSYGIPGTAQFGFISLSNITPHYKSPKQTWFLNKLKTFISLCHCSYCCLILKCWNTIPFHLFLLPVHPLVVSSVATSLVNYPNSNSFSRSRNSFHLAPMTFCLFIIKLLYYYY